MLQILFKLLEQTRISGDHEVDASVCIRSRLQCDPGFDGIFRDIYERLPALPSGKDCFAPKAIVPHMPTTPSHHIVTPGKHAQNPLHNTGKALICSWLNHKVDMIVHDTEVPYRESVAAFRLFEYRQEKDFYSRRFQDVLLAVDPRGHVVFGTVHQKSFLSHISIYGVRTHSRLLLRKISCSRSLMGRG